MSGVELGLALAGLVPACYEVGKKLVKTCRAVRSASSALSDRANVIEQYWLRVEIQLPFVRDMGNYLDDRQSSTSSDGSTAVEYTKGKFAIHKSSLSEAIAELDNRQRNSEATWLLMAVHPNAVGPTPIDTAKKLHRELITAKIARRRDRDGTQVLLDPVTSAAGMYASTLKDLAILKDEDGAGDGGIAAQISNSLFFIFRIPPTQTQIQSVRGRLLQGRVAVFYVHFYEFIHKNIRPETILILGNKTRFDVVRNVDGKTSRSGDDDWEKDIYRHPNRQGRSPQVDYEMRHDIYSLGVCLLEIGLWESFVTYEIGKQSEGPQTLRFGPGLNRNGLSGPQFLTNFQLFKEHLLSLVRGRLRRQMGTKYCGVVETCLTCLDEANVDFGDEKEFQDEDGVIVGATYIQKVIKAERDSCLDAGPT
ncbi:hypothetical protein NM208_g5208 [Fusarium decemcellulare]|uniref:Uncharacterized protein n=2 Tax=Fusarium decemcellulare TaxID=57161 RepID=A0ACC1SHX3_9HYPO|nr:hypothetical protein NM208_g5473 [Fusarium decemcellulare]KAJ3540090.1 hypothetical protein NM208_g5208 [Fusarium decemcellulare]